jgi:hypothetical protein
MKLIVIYYEQRPNAIGQRVKRVDWNKRKDNL